MNNEEWKKYKEFFDYWKNKKMSSVCTPMVIGFKKDLEDLLEKINKELDCRD
mgnify:CR=1 FL=1